MYSIVYRPSYAHTNMLIAFSLRICPLAFTREVATSLDNLVRMGLYDMVGSPLLSGAGLKLPFHAHAERP